MAAISSTIGVTATLRRASKNPKEPSRGVDLDVIAVASVASGPSGLVHKVVARDGPGQRHLSTNWSKAQWTFHHPSTSASHRVRTTLPFARPDRRARPNKS